MTPQDTFLYAIAKHLENLVIISALRLHAEVPEAGATCESITRETEHTSACMAAALRNVGEL